MKLLVVLSVFVLSSCNALRDPALQAQILDLANEIVRIEAEQQRQEGRK